MKIPTRKQFLRGCKEFEKRERRDSMYKVTTFLVSHFWSRPHDLADSLGVLLLTWNQAFYRYGVFDFDKLEECIERNHRKLTAFRRRTIHSLSESDEEEIKSMFDQFLSALKIDKGKMRGRKSPVGVAKALHILAPKFFPIWDDRIARAYGCHYSKNPSQKYFEFCEITRDIADKVRGYTKRSDKTILKLIDEYNYSKYTANWI